MAESRVAIYGAIGSNVAITVTKFIVAGITGSSAMLSEGIHSLVDSGNGVLLLIGSRRSERPANSEHPFGHGKELYFWSLIVAVLIFGVGGGVSFYEGIVHIRNPVPMTDPFWNYVVLGCAAVFEGTSFAIAFRQFSRQRGNQTLWRALRGSKDPAIFTVLAEDSAALAGLAIAALGIWLGHHFERPEIDGVASLLIGLLLAAVAVLLVMASRRLLVGAGIRPETAKAIRELAGAQPAVRSVGTVLSMYIGADEVLVTLELGFADDTLARDVMGTIAHIEAEVRQRFPMIKRVYIEPVVPAPA